LEVEPAETLEAIDGSRKPVPLARALRKQTLIIHARTRGSMIVIRVGQARVEVAAQGGPADVVGGACRLGVYAQGSAITILSGIEIFVGLAAIDMTSGLDPPAGLVEEQIGRARCSPH
jgi:hypothetical protein